MENLNRRIKSEMDRYSAKSLFSGSFLKSLNIQKNQLNANFEQWIINLNKTMYHRKYRAVVGEIENRKQNFKLLEELHWKYQYIEIDAIFKILKKKIFKHKQEISKEDSHHYNSCLFWFNQIFLILEQFILEIRPDLNKKFNYKNIKILKPIQGLIDSFIKFFYLLLIFAQYNQQLPDILSYLSLIKKFVPFIKYSYKSSSYIYLQKIQLFKVKILTENCNYLYALNCLESNIGICFDYIKILVDEKFNVYKFDLNNEKNRNNFQILQKKRFYKIYEYKGFIKQNDNVDNANRLDFVINNKKDLLSLNQQKLKNIKELNILNKSSSKNVILFMEEGKLENLEEKKFNINNYNSLNKINKSHNKTKRQREFQSLIGTNKIIKRNNIITKKSIDKNLNKTVIRSETKKRTLRLKKFKTVKNAGKNKKAIIEEVLSIIALNFYLRGAIFEHVGNIDSALDSYKEVEWFSLNFLNNKYPAFVKYTSSLLNCAWSNYNIIYKIKYEKVKKKKKNELLRDLEFIKKRERMAAQERYNKDAFSANSTKLLNDKRLNNFLKELGNKIYKEEEQRNIYIYNKFSTNGYILSTYKMVNDLLSDDFRQILKKMKKVEITKQNEEIKDQIDKALMKREHQYSIKENDENINSLIHTIDNTIDNTKSNSTILKEYNNTNRNPKNKIKSLKKNKYNTLCLEKRSYKNNNKFISNSIENSAQKISTSCEISNNKFKNNSLIYSYKDFGNKYNKNKLPKKNSENQIISHKFFNIGDTNRSKISKMSSVISSFRTSQYKDNPEKYSIDKDNFNKRLIKKKKFLDKYSHRDFTFLKDLLDTKSYLEEVVKPISELELKKSRHDADVNFHAKLEIAKAENVKKNLNNLIKQDDNVETNIKNEKNIKYIENNSETSSEQFENYNIKNNEKLKQIEKDYNNIIIKRNILFNPKKRFYQSSKSLFK